MVETLGSSPGTKRRRKRKKIKMIVVKFMKRYPTEKLKHCKQGKQLYLCQDRECQE
jgi:hypothetical protein